MDIIMKRIIDLLEQRHYKHITCELWGDEGGVPIVVVDHALGKNASDAQRGGGCYSVASIRREGQRKTELWR